MDRDLSNLSEMLRKRACQDAARRAPAFSEARHARLMRAVERAEPGSAGKDPIVPRPATYSVPDLMAIAMIVSFGLSVGIAMLVERGQSAKAPASVAQLSAGAQRFGSGPVVTVDVTRQMDAVPHEVTAVLATAVARQQWAGLDDDARRVTRYLADQVPFQAEWNRRERSQKN
jgi:hypothetical protein